MVLSVSANADQEKLEIFIFHIDEKQFDDFANKLNLEIRDLCGGTKCTTIKIGNITVTLYPKREKEQDKL